ncbi:MAG: biotin--[acetyl-CoA-carboxylase] ligase [Pseudomonadota bacterium]
MVINPVSVREHEREYRLMQLLRSHCISEISLRNKQRHDKAEVIMRRGSDIGSSICCFEHLPRGIDKARELIETEEAAGRAFNSGAIILAGEMSRSKGRFSRPWHAPSGGLWLTVILHPALLPKHCHFYSVIAAVACCEATRHYGAQSSIKWVNDIHYENRKMAGIIAETYRSRSLREEYIFLGMGINVNNTEFPESLRPVAVSLSETIGKEIFVDDFAAVLLSKLIWYSGLMLQFEADCLENLYEPEQPRNPIIEQWKAYSDTIGKRVRYGFDVMNAPLFEATVLDVDDTGAIVLHCEKEGVSVTESAGEIVYLN